MHDTAHSAPVFLQALVFLAAAVVAIPLARRAGLGSIIGYLAAGLVIGPHGLGLFNEPETVLSAAEVGVVFLLFIIGLELRPTRLWAMRRDIFGLGLAQVLVCGALLGAVMWAAGLGPAAATVVGLGLALSSTAFALPMLEERGELASPHGERAFAILLLQDLAIVPLLALVALLAPAAPDDGDTSLLVEAGIMVGALTGLWLAGRYLLNPMFRILAKAGAREIMTAAALLVVLGAAAAMHAVGLSMAMGAFLAGVLLAESSFRHELEADIEPFRGLLLGLFFMAVGMSLDLAAVWDNLLLVAGIVVAVVVVKCVAIYAVARSFDASHEDAAKVGAILSQGGEFAFVLFTAAAVTGLLEREQAALLVAAVTLSMAVTPLVVAGAERLTARGPREAPDEDFSDARGTVLVVGFSRFGQIAAQLLLADGAEVTAIDDDVEMIEAAGRFGFKVYYGDGTRLDVMRAAGTERAAIIAICVDSQAASLKIVEMARSEFPCAKIFARAYDRTHALQLLARDVDYQIRETYESAIVFGRTTLEALGVPPERAADVEADVRMRDADRLAMQMSEGIYAGMDILHQRTPRPEPLTEPRRKAERLDEAEDADAAE